MPIPIRQAMLSVTEWTLTLQIHDAFMEFCSCVRNTKASEATALFAGDPSISYTRYWAALQKCKNITQWKARALAAGLPSEAVLAIRGMGDAGRLMVVGFISKAQPGDAITADLRQRSHFIDAETDTYPSQ